jgi:hypothetical protein
MVKKNNAYNVLVEKRGAKLHMEDLDVYGMIILKWVAMKLGSSG